MYGFAANLELGQLAFCVSGKWDDPNSRVTVVDACISKGVYPVFSSPYGKVTFRPPRTCAERKPPDAFWDRDRQLSAAIRCADKAVAGALAITEVEHSRLELVTTGSESLHTEVKALAELSPDRLMPHVQRLLTLELGGEGHELPHTSVSAAVELTLDKLQRDALAPHADLMVARLVHVHPSARRRALVRLAALGSELLGKHVPKVIDMLADPVGSVRAAAIDALGCLDEQSQRQHAGSVAALLAARGNMARARHAALLALGALKALEEDAQGQPKGLVDLGLVVERLADDAPFVCFAAASLFKKAAGTAKFAAQVVVHLQHAEVGARLAALDALSSLEPVVIARHALKHLVMLVGAAEYDEATGGAAFEMLKQLAPADLEAHVPAIAGWLEHEDGSVPAAKRCRLTLELLAPKLEPASLASMGEVLIARLVDDLDIQNAAVLALGLLELKVLGAERVRQLVQLLTHSTPRMRNCAIKVLQKLGPALSEHAAPLLTLLLVGNKTGAVQSGAVRTAALEAMSSFEAGALMQYADQWVHCLDDTSQAARAASLRLLVKLEPSALAKYAAGLVAHISETPQMLVGVLLRLEPSELAVHAAALGKHLKHNECEVREAVLNVMSRLPPKSLECYALGIIEAIADPEEGVRRAAKNALGKLEQETLTLHAATFIAHLDNEKAAIRVSALGTLVKLKPAALSVQLTVQLPRPASCNLSSTAFSDSHYTDPQAHATKIVKCLSDEDGAVQDAANSVLMRLRPGPRAEHVASVLSLLGHGNKSVRNNAIEAIQMLSGREGRAALLKFGTELMDQLMDTSDDGDAQEVKLQALAKIDTAMLKQAHMCSQCTHSLPAPLHTCHPCCILAPTYESTGSQVAGSDSLAKLLKLLQAPSYESHVRVAALRLLIKVLPKPTLEGQVRILMHILEHEASDMQDAAIHALSAFRPEAMGEAIKLLLPLLDSTNGTVRGVSLRALRRLLETALPHLSVPARQKLLLRVLVCVEDDVTGNSAAEVFESGMFKLLTKDNLRVLLRAVEPLLMYESKVIRRRAGGLVSRMGPWAIKQVATLPVGKLAEDDETLSSGFAIIREGGAPTVDAHAPLLARLCAHEDYRVRLTATATLSKGSSPRQHAALFVDKLSDVDEDVRRAALLALQQVRTTATALHSPAQAPRVLREPLLYPSFDFAARRRLAASSSRSM